MFGARKRAAVLTVVSALAFTVGTAPAQAAHPDERIVLQGASSTEGIAAGAGSTFYAGDLFLGDIYRAVEFIADRPEGSERTDDPRVRVKIVVRYRYKIFYRLVDRDVEIVHVRHSSRRPWRSGEAE